MKEEYLPFEICVEAVEHAFIKVDRSRIKSMIDFHHPSIRDMILEEIGNSQKRRMEYIKSATISGISEIIMGLRHYREKENNTHTITLKSDKEIEILRERMRELIISEKLDDNIIKMIEKVIYLLPKEGNKTKKASELDLDEIEKKPVGILMCEIIENMKCVAYYNKNKDVCIKSWIELIRKLYTISQYIKGAPRIEYTKEIDKRNREMTLLMELEYLNCLYMNEPMIFRQIYGDSREEMIKTYIEQEVEEIEDQYYEYQEENEERTIETYQDIKERTEHIRNIIEIYEKISNKEQKAKQIIDTIKYEIEEPEYIDEDYYEDENYYEKEYWSIERIFEDI